MDREIAFLLVEVGLQDFLGYWCCSETALDVVLGHNAFNQDSDCHLGLFQRGETDEPRDIELHIVVPPLPRARLARQFYAFHLAAPGGALGGRLGHARYDGIVVFGGKADGGGVVANWRSVWRTI